MKKKMQSDRKKYNSDRLETRKPEKKKIISRHSSDGNCPYAKKCGGCDYAGMKYDNELAVKQKYIEELFGEYVKVDDIVGFILFG